mgnify:CR=1 FL=1|jgi:hypothetical protein
MSLNDSSTKINTINKFNCYDSRLKKFKTTSIIDERNNIFISDIFKNLQNYNLEKIIIDKIISTRKNTDFLCFEGQNIIKQKQKKYTKNIDSNENYEIKDKIKNEMEKFLINEIEFPDNYLTKKLVKILVNEDFNIDTLKNWILPEVRTDLILDMLIKNEKISVGLSEHFNCHVHLYKRKKVMKKSKKKIEKINKFRIEGKTILIKKRSEIEIEEIDDFFVKCTKYINELKEMKNYTHWKEDTQIDIILNSLQQLYNGFLSLQSEKIKDSSSSTNLYM